MKQKFNTGKRPDYAKIAQHVSTCGAMFSYPSEELAKVLKQLGASVVSFSKGELLAKEGDAPSKLYCVLSGVLLRRVHYLDNESIPIGAIRPGEFAGVSMLFKPGSRHQADIVGSIQGEVLEIEMAELCKWPRHSSKSSRFLMFLAAKMSEEVEAARQNSIILSCGSIAERMMLYLEYRSRKENAKVITIPCNEADFASYLGANPAALSRVISNLRAEGRFSNHKNVFTLP